MKNILAPLGVLVLVGFVWSASGQGLPGSAPGVNAALSRLFGPHTNFSATADVRVLDKDQQENMSLVMDFAMLDGKLRAEVDLAKAKGRQFSPQLAAQMEQMGMGQVVSIARPDQKTIYLVYPGLKSYARVPMPPEAVEAMDKETQIETTKLGEETIDGRVCVKHKVVVTSAKRGPQEAVVWNAKDLKGFPVRIQTRERDNTVWITYRDVQLAKPAASRFEPPAEFTAYDSIQQLMMGAARQMMPNSPR